MRLRDLFLRRESQPEQRSIEAFPWGVGETYSSPAAAVTQDSALRLAPVYSAVRLLADSISTLPIRYSRKVGPRREVMSRPPDLFALLTEAGDLPNWLCRMMMSLALQGNAIGVITNRDDLAYATGVMWRPRSEFFVDDDSNISRPQWYWMGRRIERTEIVHVPWLTIPGRTLGLSPIEAFALTVNAGLSAQSYSSSWFEAGGVPPGTFKNSEQMVDQAQADLIKARLVSAIRSRKPIVYGRDWDYTPITIPPEQAQFVESQRLTASQIAAIYGVPPSKIGGEPGSSTLTYANAEQDQIDFVMFTLRPWLVKLESAFSALLPQRQYAKFNVDALIRADLKTRHEVYKIDREIGLHSVDELRALEDLSPLPDGQGSDYEPLGTAASEPMSGAEETPRLAGRHIAELEWVLP